MPTRATIEDFLDQSHLAFVGVSSNLEAFVKPVHRDLRDCGRTLCPVNGSAEPGRPEGHTSYRQLADVPIAAP